jgi:hypothetical protein
MSDAREAFEKWAQGNSLLLNIREELMYAAGYINVKEMAWEAWQAALQSGEPVAWMYEHDGMVHDEFHQPVFTTRRWDFVNEPYTESPLYTTPQPVVPEVVFDILKAAQGSCRLGLNDIADKQIQIAIKALLSAGKENNK